MSAESKSKQFLACLECGDVVMGTRVPLKEEKSKSNTNGKARLKVTYCRKCVLTTTIKRANTSGPLGVCMSINKRMIETWYVYRALTRFTEEGIDVDGDDNETAASTIRLISRDDFIHPGKETYELTSISIDATNPEDIVAQMCPYLLTGFF